MEGNQKRLDGNGNSVTKKDGEKQKEGAKNKIVKGDGKANGPDTEKGVVPAGPGAHGNGTEKPNLHDQGMHGSSRVTQPRKVKTTHHHQMAQNKGGVGE